MSHAMGEALRSRVTGGHPALRADNITMASGSGRPAVPLLAMGVMAIGAALGLGKAGFGGSIAAQALASYHVGVMSVLAICLSGTIFLMIFHLLNTGWTATIRRQLENIVAFLPIAYLMVIAGVAADLFAVHGIFRWADPANYEDELLIAKWAWFFAPQDHGHDGHAVFPFFFVVRAFAYGAIWWYLSRRLIRLSDEQDRTGDASLSLQARFTSSWGILVMALTTAFASFDWLMSADYRFFSTMWGVYFFAGGSFAMFATLALVLSILRGKGKLEGAVTPEHFHDLGKLLFSFTVFWGYIAFSQYFLIWYSNIPEETSYYVHRVEHGWKGLGVALILGHFAFPFLFLMSRNIKKSLPLLSLGAAVALLAHAADLFWIVRPMVYAEAGAAEPSLGVGARVVDVLGIVGVALVFAGFLVRRVGQRPLVAINDPYLREGLSHRNYV